MPIESVLFLCLVMGALGSFAAALAYADWVWKRPPAPRIAPELDTTAKAAADQTGHSNYKQAA